MPCERRLERETGIEPATNSLEGCDSTTELLPPSRSSTRCSRRSHAPPTATSQPRRRNSAPPPRSALAAKQTAPPTSNSANSHATAREKVGGEGRVRTSVARRRQVYSLLRLTALPPPRNSFVVLTAVHDPRWHASAAVIHEIRGLVCPRYRASVWNPCVFGASLKMRRSRPMELAEGFEPPTS